MTGMMCAVMGGAVDGSYIVNVGKSEINSIVFINDYGFLTSSIQGTPGSITPIGATFKGVTIVAVYSRGTSIGNASTYTVSFQGDRRAPAGFFNTLKVDGTTVVGNLQSPVYNSGSNQTSFTINLTTSPVATLFGTVVDATKPIVMT